MPPVDEILGGQACRCRRYGQLEVDIPAEEVAVVGVEPEIDPAPAFRTVDAELARCLGELAGPGAECLESQQLALAAGKPGGLRQSAVGCVDGQGASWHPANQHLWRASDDTMGDCRPEGVLPSLFDHDFCPRPIERKHVHVRRVVPGNRSPCLSWFQYSFALASIAAPTIFGSLTEANPTLARHPPDERSPREPSGEGSSNGTGSMTGLSRGLIGRAARGL